MQITLDLTKKYLRIMTNDEDDIIQNFISGVEIFAKHYISNNIDFANLPQDLVNAMLDHIAFLYENRGNLEVQTPSRITYVYKKYKNFRLI
ncbi:head-tail connector protein [Candidatus Deianiraea vastatrix]|uniref:Phage gp6-like head-tail connector protein n=1 Tax=Candidatus Deianiraea vastatrix TaxID=2163644 RepID=A0A5B8XDV8_9RICK|nr:head-tail connector protein [Candidatus Deianiraea vastatrix]QED23492.1 Phage gp6-like head-tail connector protein [Candidatus Deianiraea vastatrix]